jgi:ankyrin repeat protein
LKVNARKKNMQGETVLHTAIRNQTHGEIIKKLTTNIFDINERISQYGTFLNLAIEAGQSENFFFLIKHVGIRYTITD